MYQNCMDQIPAIRDIYARHCAGCCLHIVLDDGNVRDDCVDFCIDAAQEKGHKDCEAVAVALRAMTKTQRMKLANYRTEQI